MSKPQLYVTESDAGLELSCEEFAEADFQPPFGYERARRRIVVIPPPGFEHSLIKDHFRDYLGAYRLENRELVDHVFSEPWFQIDDSTDRTPDICVYLTKPEETEKHPRRVPDIIFEIVSPESPHDRDYKEKRKDYERQGVKEYVIVDRFEHCVTLLQLEDGKYSQTRLSNTDSYTTPLLPGLQIPLKGIL